MTSNISVEDLQLIIKGSEHELVILDRLISVSLAYHFRQGDRSIFMLCQILAHRDFSQILMCQDVAVILIEKFLDPNKHLDEAIYALNYLKHRKSISSPIWFYLARGKHRLSDHYFNAIDMRFFSNPAFFSEVVSPSGDKRFLSHIVTKLTELAPFIKFLPITPTSHEIIIEHENWLRIGKSYIDILNSGNNKSQYDQSYLKKRFLDPLTSSEFIWLNKVEEGRSLVFRKKRALYFDSLVCPPIKIPAPDAP